MKFFNKLKFGIKFRIKNGYVYIYHKNKEVKEKISNKNINIVFILNLVKQVYFRHQLLQANVVSNFGYVFDAMVTACGAGVVDVLSKCILSKIKNNKKSAHIFVAVNPKYNEDIFNVKINYIIRMSAIDIIYTLFVTIIKTIYFKLQLKLNKEKKGEKV